MKTVIAVLVLLAGCRCGPPEEGIAEIVIDHPAVEYAERAAVWVANDSDPDAGDPDAGCDAGDAGNFPSDQRKLERPTAKPRPDGGP